MKVPPIGSIVCDACGGPVPENDKMCRFCGAKVVVKPPPSPPSWLLGTAAPTGEPRTYCPRCQRFFKTELGRCPRCPTIEATSADVNCPACKTPLAAERLGPVMIDRCAACGGAWFDGDEIGRVVDLRTTGRTKQALAAIRSDLPVAPPRLESGWLRCVRCSSTMDRRPIARRSGVVVDVCATHGLWLDKNELEQFTAFVKAGGLEVLRQVATLGGATASPRRVRPSERRRAPPEGINVLSAMLEFLTLWP